MPIVFKQSAVLTVKTSHTLGQASSTSCSTIRQRGLENRVEWRPVFLDDRKPACVAIANLLDHVVAEDAFKAKSVSISGPHLRRVCRIAFPFHSPIVQAEAMPDHHNQGFG
jgi:hypothetical protein